MLASARRLLASALCIGLVLLASCAHAESDAPLGFDILLLDSATTPDVEALQQSLQSFPSVQRVDYVSKEEALLAFEREMSDEPQVIEGLDDSNPLPASLVVVLSPGSTSEDLESVTRKIEGLPQFRRVVLGADLPDDGWWLRYKGE